MSLSGSRVGTVPATVTSALGGARAITVPGSILALLALFVGTEGVTIPVAGEETVGLAIAANLAAVGASSLVLVAGNLMRRRTSALASVVVCFLAVGVVHALLIDCLPWVRLPPASLAELIVADSVLALIWLALAAVTLTGFDNYRAARVQARARARHLTAQRSRTQRQQDRYRMELDRLVATAVYPGIDREVARLDRLERQANYDAADVRAATDGLRRCAESVARRTSHELWDSDPASADAIRPDPPTASTNRPADTSWSTRQLLAMATRVQPFAPVGSGVLVTLVSLPTLLLDFGWTRGALVAVTIGLLVAGVLAVARTTSTRRLRRWDTRRRMAGILVWYCAAAAAGSLALLLKPAQAHPVWWAWLSQLLLLVIIAGIWGSVVAVGQLRHGLEAEVGALKATTLWEAARSQTELGQMRDRLASCLHGSIQGRLAAAALLLEAAAPGNAPSATRESTAKRQETVRFARLALVEGREELALATRRPDRTDIALELERIASAWCGAAAIVATVATDARERIDRVYTLRGAVVSAAEEGVSNAVCHGLARSITIDIEVGQGAVILTVRDDGIGPPRSTEFGYGLRSLATRGARVSLRREGRMTLLTVRFPTELGSGAGDFS